MRKTLKVTAAGAALCAFSAFAFALINPDFTPRDLLDQSGVILLIRIDGVDRKGLAAATVEEVLKGRYRAKKLKIDFMAGAFERVGREASAQVSRGHRAALLFIGSYREGGGGDGPDDMDEGPKGYLHLGGTWYVCEKDEGTWGIATLNSRLQGTWAGSTDMLLRVIRLIQADPDTEIPVNAGASWGSHVRFAPSTKLGTGRLSGKVSAAAPVDPAGKGRVDLFVAGDAGDRLFRWNGRIMQDATAKLGLKSRSQAFAWADLTGDGRVDLASWDGRRLRIHAQKADGTFVALSGGTAIKEGCLALSVVGSGGRGRAALLASTRGVPLLFVPQAGGGLKARPIARGAPGARDLGKASRCFVADFDGDGFPDVLQLFEKGGLFYKGKAGGTWSAPVTTSAGVGRGRHAACLGDYDADGLPDLFVAGEVRNRMWQNVGGGRFAEMLAASGEIGYISKAGGVSVQTADVNNDGRQDLFIAYGTERHPHLFFNRGFRSFGHARKLDLNEQKLLAQAGKGQQAGCLGDFNGDGALDMALVLANGEAWLFLRKVEEDEPALAVVAALSPGAPYAGPVTVRARREKYEFGSWTVHAGGAGAFFGVVEPGPVQISWRFPGGREQKREVVVEEGVVRVLLDRK